MSDKIHSQHLAPRETLHRLVLRALTNEIDNQTHRDGAWPRPLQAFCACGHARWASSALTRDTLPAQASTFDATDTDSPVRRL